MLKILIVTAASLVMFTAAAAAHSPRKERSEPAAQVGKSRIGKYPAGKAPIGNYPQKPEGKQTSPLEDHLHGGDSPHPRSAR